MSTIRKSKSIVFAILLIAAALFVWEFLSSSTQPAHADMGPKPSVTVTIENIGGKVCYGTLLSYYESLGPTAAYDPEKYPYPPKDCNPEIEGIYDAEKHAIWQAFVDYADPDGYYYQQLHWRCDETGEISWNYYPPSKFKILLYFPETQTFVSSGVYERYAFHSYFTATLSDSELAVTQPPTISVSKSYDYTWEIISLVLRIVATILIELGVAWLLRLRTKKLILSVLVVNVITQTAMNIALNVLSFFQGGWAILWYIPIELAVFVVEAIAYMILFNRTQSNTIEADGRIMNSDYLSKGKCVLLSFVANFFSFAAGIVLALFVPGIF